MNMPPTDTDNPVTLFAKIRRYSSELFKSILIALALALVFKSSLVEATQVYGESMTPTLVEGDYILVNKLCYGLHLPFIDKMAYMWSAPRRGDVITFFPPESSLGHGKKMFVKRVVAVAGDKVEMSRSRLYINGRPVTSRPGRTHDFVKHEIVDGKEYRVLVKDKTSSFGPLVVPEGYVFVIGDNRDNSYDSRDWGPLPVESVNGKAIVIYFTKIVSYSLSSLMRVGETL